MAWVAQKVYSEDLPVSALLPESLSLAKEVEDLRTRLAKERTEPGARAVVTDLNKRILRAIQRPQAGPPMRVGLQDVDAVVERWRQDRGA